MVGEQAGKRSSTGSDLDKLNLSAGNASEGSTPEDSLTGLQGLLASMDSEKIQSLDKIAPRFREFGLDAIRAMKANFDTTVNANQSSTELAHEAFADARKLFADELDRVEISQAEREFLYAQISQTAESQSSLDRENKAFLKEILEKTLPVVAGVAVAIVAVGMAISSNRDAQS